MRPFSRWVGIDKDTGTVFAQGADLPAENLRRWSVEDERAYPNAKLNLPPDMVLASATGPGSTYCYGIDRKEAERAKLLPAQ